MVDLNRKREHDTYAKMFNKQSSVSEYVASKAHTDPLNYKSMEDKDFETKKRKMDLKVKRMIEQKMMEFSFEVSEERKHYPEVDDIQEIIDKAEESYKLFKKTGRRMEAKEIKKKLEEARFAKEHFIMVMNMDFSRPTKKMIEMAKQHNIDLKDKLVIAEFKKI